jgi:hypothetical protein
MRRATWRSVMLCVVAFVVLLLIIWQVLDAGMRPRALGVPVAITAMPWGSAEPTERYRLLAIPIVLSHIYYGRPYDYVGYKRLEIPFEAADAKTDELIPKLKSVPDLQTDGLFFILADDKGTVDFVLLAFVFYGLKTLSLYYMYCTILAVSSLLFAAAYFRHLQNLALLVFSYLALYVTMPAFTMFPSVISIIDPRVFGILSLVASLHLLLAATDPNPLRPVQWKAIVLQVLIMTFVYHVRASTIFQTMLIAVAYPVIVYVSAPEAAARRPAVMARRFFPLALLLTAIGVLLPVYQRVMYNPVYFGQRALLHHVAYHPLLLGLYWNPVLRNRYGLVAGGDLGAANAVDDYLYRIGQHRTPELRHWAAVGQNTITTQRPFNWVDYNKATRDLYLSIWREQPKQMALTYLYHHPLYIYRLFTLYTGTLNTQGSLANGAHFYNPVKPVCLLVLVLTTLLGCDRGEKIRAIHVFIAFVVVAASLAVPLVFYAGGFLVLAEAFVAAGLLLYTTLAFLLLWLMTRAGARVVRCVRSGRLSQSVSGSPPASGVREGTLR